MDLQAHMVEQHGATMSARDKKDARRVVPDFEFNEAGPVGADRRRQVARSRGRDQLDSAQQVRSDRSRGANASLSEPGPPSVPPDRQGAISLPFIAEGDLSTAEFVSYGSYDSVLISI